MAYVSIEDLYTNLSPASIQDKSSVKKKDIFDGVADCIYDPNGKSFSYEEIKNRITAHFTSSEAESAINEFKAHFHGIGESGSIFKDDKYWEWEQKILKPRNPKEFEIKVEKTTNAGDIVDALHDNSKPNVSVFSIKGPRINPAARGSKKIDFFLNYTPSIVTAQMIPYLDVSFRIKGTARGSITTPSIIRFLLGSGPVGSLSSGDQFIQNSGFSEASMTGSSGYGMEMFLMPQTLTNMDALGESSNGLTRLNRVKPFVPFASIESFDVTIMNAGAGAFAHKKGSLKLKIHDKARLPEISEFIKGGSGFNRMSIETVYGWSAPSNGFADIVDEYSNFINDNMKIKDMWLVSNSQFSFDGSGQASVSIEMMSQSAKVLQDKTVVGTETGTPFFKAINTLSELKSKITSSKSYSKNANTESFYNAIATPGDLSKLDKVNLVKAGADLRAMAGRAGLDDEEKDNFSKAINLVCAPKAWEGLKKSIDQHINDKFKQVTMRTDPFLRSLMKNNEIFKKIYIDFMHAKKDQKFPSIVSFGKLFLTFICSQIDANDCHELQVFFYGLNDECGYMSGASISEFPIDLDALKKAYDDFVKKTLTLNVPIESFLSIVSDSHFSNSMTPAYGVGQFYGLPDPKKENKRELLKNKGTESDMEKFFEEWGDLKIPIIEMFAETTETTDKKIIKRVHIYDRQNSPYGFQQDVITDDNENITIAKLDKKKMRDLLNENGVTHAKLRLQSKKQLEDIKKTFNKGSKTGDTPPQAFPGVKTANIIDETYGVQTFNIADRGSVKLFLMKSVPTISIGTNGSLVLSVSAASKADGTQGAINIINAAKGQTSTNVPSIDGLVEDKNLPLRSVPMQVTMSTLGVPIAQLYQTFFIDFGTGTTIDNIYSASQIQHSIAQGKFTTNWTFIYTNGYAKFCAPTKPHEAINAAANDKVVQEESAREAKDIAKKKKPAPQK